MNVSYSVFDFNEVTAINEEHGVYLVKHKDSGKLFIKKILTVYNPDVYNKLLSSPVPGTPKIVCMQEIDSSLILIETFISGTSLGEMLENQAGSEASGRASAALDGGAASESDTLTLEKITKIALDILGVLSKLHAMEPPVIHRDIKPSNIIINEAGDAILLDFNAAKKYNPEADADTRLLGTQGYAAPEQYGFGSSSPQTDIYSLGVLLKEMLAACPEKSENLSAVAEKCAMLDPKDRYRDADSVAADIRLGVNPKEGGETPGTSFTDRHSGTPEIYGGDNSLSNEFAEAPEKRKYPNKITSFFPPGFRSLKPIRMAVAFAYYSVMGTLCFSITSDRVTGKALWAYRTFAYILFLLPVFTIFDYKNIQSLIPLSKSKSLPLRIIGLVLLNTLLFIIWTVIFVNLPEVRR